MFLRVKPIEWISLVDLACAWNHFFLLGPASRSVFSAGGAVVLMT